MEHRDNRIDPTFEEDETPAGQRDVEPPPFDPEPGDSQMHTAIRVAAVVIVATCLFFVGDRLYARYQAQQVVKALERELESLGVYMTQSLEQAGATMEQANRQARARAAAAAKEQQERIEQQRRARMATTEGGWLGKNCADWTRSWEQTRAETAAREMNKHCGRYERYLETGIAPPGTPPAASQAR